ncbi:uncharacterized protein LOC117106669, partial [Anneissia japonica]|uniref:uncharacterized protein LOC117106669 n=1 Tax=Anneissia japonica TaxID=1529436 RepID=UPI00142558D1
MDTNTFDNLLKRVTPIIKRNNTSWQECIFPGERLAITLRYMATGETYKSLSYQYRTPSTTKEWHDIANSFQMKWNFPNCLGALDGKHVNLQPPPNSGSEYFNYKNSFSMVLMALVDSSYKFLYVDFGTNGRVSDGGVFSKCSLDKGLKNKAIGVPNASPLPGTNVDVPYMIVADEAFPLREDIMKPYPLRQLTKEQRVFNYRLSRARRVSENTFGIFSNRFGVFRTTIKIRPENVEPLVFACAALHNMLRCNTEYASTHLVVE